MRDIVVRACVWVGLYGCEDLDRLTVRALSRMLSNIRKDDRRMGHQKGIFFFFLHCVRVVGFGPFSIWIIWNACTVNSTSDYTLWTFTAHIPRALALISNFKCIALRVLDRTSEEKLIG
jgi:hypothetical protein